MPASGESEAEESRTQSVGVKRNVAGSDGGLARHSNPNKRSRKGRLDLEDRDFLPKGTAFSMMNDSVKTQGGSAVNSETHSTHRATASQPARINWNKGLAQGTIRTSLRGGNMKQTYAKSAPPEEGGKVPPLVRTGSLAQSSTGESEANAIEISDSDESELEGGMTINVEAREQATAAVPMVVSDEEMEEGEMLSSGQPTESQISSPNSYDYNENAHNQSQGNLHGSSHPDSSTSAGPHAWSSSRRLADLNPDELEDQLKYTLFHLSREQVDLSRVVICTACLQEGHMEDTCPERNCVHCETRGEHASRMCPQYRRCVRCRERGHDVSTCVSKLKNNSIPCDHCGHDNHLEDTCSMRFFPQPPPEKKGRFKLWISCCHCAGTDHLVGDCPALNPELAPQWSLRSLDPRQITNMSLESGTRTHASNVMNRGMRPEGLKIKGRAELHRPNDKRGMSTRDDHEDEELFLRPPVGKQKPPQRIGQAQSGHAYNGPQRIRFQSPGYDDYEDGPPNNYRGHDPRGRESWYATDSFGNRRRSRSPESGYHRNRYDDEYRPGLPARYQDPHNEDSWSSGFPRGRNSPRRRTPSPGRDEYRSQHQLPRRPPSPSSMRMDSYRPPLPREPVPGHPPSPPQMQLPTRQGSNQWLNDQEGQGPLSAADFQSKSDPGLSKKERQRLNTLANRASQNNQLTGKGNKSRKDRTQAQKEQSATDSLRARGDNQMRRNSRKTARLGNKFA